jgi:NADH-quinone oxidoreductase subunit G
VGSAELGIFHRGDESQIGLFPGRVLDNAYSGNVIDLCPVGALTSTAYRFQSRPWDLVHKVDSTCALCSRGCSITLDVRHRQREGAQVLRVRPRHNPAVNGYWMCDEGRFGARRYTEGPRLARPVLRWGGGPVEAEWEETLRGLAGSLRGLLDRHGPRAVGVIASAFLTNEELYLVRRFAADVLGTPHVDHRLRPSQA